MVKRTLRYPTRPLTVIAAVAVLVAAAAVAIVLLLSAGAPVAAIAPPRTIAVSAEFDPATPGFGDRIDARIVIALNRRAVRSQTLRYTYGLAPLTLLGGVRTSRFVSGDLELVSLVAPVACVTAPCVARTGVTTLGFPMVRATVLSTSGARQSVSTRWPALPIRGRLFPSDLSASPKFEANASPPAPSYSVSPSTMSALLDVLAALCAVGAVVLAAWQALVFVRRRPAQEVGALERALRLAREAENLPVPHRRRAVGLLARLLGRDRLSSTASELAWSEHKPRPDELEALVSEIERGGPE
jgi:hypothetical protein